MMLVATLNNMAFTVPKTLTLALGSSDASLDSPPLGEFVLGEEDFTVRAFPPPGSAVFLSAPVEVPIPAGQNTVTVEIEIEGADDRVFEETETFTITASVAGVAMSGAVTFAIGDDDERGVTVTPVSSSSVEEENGFFTYRFAVQLNTQPTGNVIINLRESADLSLPPGFTLNAGADGEFTPGDWNVPQTLTLNFVDDPVASPDSRWEIIPSAMGADYTDVDIPPISGVFIDSDERGIRTRLVSSVTTQASVEKTCKTRPTRTMVS